MGTEDSVMSTDWGEAGGFQTGVCQTDLQWQKKILERQRLRKGPWAGSKEFVGILCTVRMEDVEWRCRYTQKQELCLAPVLTIFYKFPVLSITHSRKCLLHSCQPCIYGNPRS